MTTKTTNQGYFKGDKIRYTGKTEWIYGGLFYEAVYSEGHQKGQTLHTAQAPRGTTHSQRCLSILAHQQKEMK